MNQKNHPVENGVEEQLRLKAAITAAEEKLGEVKRRTSSFEAVLRAHLENEIIEEQELSVLYKQLKLAKKQKRLAQKRKGKNYIEPKALKVLSSQENFIKDPEKEKEKKRLYREAMLQSHPDKFSLQEQKMELATEVTTTLIKIYQEGSLQELKEYHTHILSGNAFLEVGSIVKQKVNLDTDDMYLKNRLAQLQKQLEEAKNKHTYKVLTEYEDPFSFISELKEYYADRISKLKKRTRKA
ncbi:hypothetical protein L1I30_01495 [Gillisia sp. M10.2A]|uniref:J domain-containing protein n=1 Tax=Gillisia lutea TaxID=2909668 RepID=A0ABS9EBS6_9FLAO|nr:hypothetical protein [Gillisia lutea]MCF4100328.1 hypothetical protein [Gillisia lutea]